jgi:hypothetical protein
VHPTYRPPPADISPPDRPPPPSPNTPAQPSFASPSSPTSASGFGLDPSAVAKQMAALSAVSHARMSQSQVPRPYAPPPAGGISAAYPGPFPLAAAPSPASSSTHDPSAPSMDPALRPAPAPAPAALQQRRQAFLVNLAGLHAGVGKPLPPALTGVPTPAGFDPALSAWKMLEPAGAPGVVRLAGRDLDLFKLWGVVTQAGGMQKVRDPPPRLVPSLTGHPPDPPAARLAQHPLRPRPARDVHEPADGHAAADGAAPPPGLQHAPRPTRSPRPPPVAGTPGPSPSAGPGTADAAAEPRARTAGHAHRVAYRTAAAAAAAAASHVPQRQRHDGHDGRRRDAGHERRTHPAGRDAAPGAAAHAARLVARDERHRPLGRFQRGHAHRSLCRRRPGRAERRARAASGSLARPGLSRPRRRRGRQEAQGRAR